MKKDIEKINRPPFFCGSNWSVVLFALAPILPSSLLGYLFDSFYVYSIFMIIFEFVLLLSFFVIRKWPYFEEREVDGTEMLFAKDIRNVYVVITLFCLINLAPVCASIFDIEGLIGWIFGEYQDFYTYFSDAADFHYEVPRPYFYEFDELVEVIIGISNAVLIILPLFCIPFESTHFEWSTIKLIIVNTILVCSGLFCCISLFCMDGKLPLPIYLLFSFCLPLMFISYTICVCIFMRPFKESVIYSLVFVLIMTIAGFFTSSSSTEPLQEIHALYYAHKFDEENKERIASYVEDSIRWESVCDSVRRVDGKHIFGDFYLGMKRKDCDSILRIFNKRTKGQVLIHNYYYKIADRKFYGNRLMSMTLVPEDAVYYDTIRAHFVEKYGEPFYNTNRKEIGYYSFDLIVNNDFSVKVNSHDETYFNFKDKLVCVSRDGVVFLDVDLRTAQIKSEKLADERRERAQRAREEAEQRAKERHRRIVERNSVGL